MKLMKRILLSIVVLIALYTTSSAANISIQSTVIPNWQSTQPQVFLRITNDPFTDENGIFHPGAPAGYFQIACTVDLNAKTLTVPAITLASTTASLDNARARYSAYFVDKFGRVIQEFERLNNFQVPPQITSISGCSPMGTCATWADIRLFNGTNLPAIDRYTYSDRVIELKLEAIDTDAIIDAPLITRTPSADLGNEFALSVLGSGILKNTTGTGVPSIAIPNTDYELPITATSPITRTGQAIGINQSLLSIAWSQLTSVPLTFAPSAHNHTAAETTSGVFATARLGGGTANSTTFLRGDQTFVQVDYGNLTGVPSTFAPSAHNTSHVTGGSDALTGLLDANAKVAVNRNSGATTGTRRRINFIEGSNITLTVGDDAGNEEVDVTIAAASAGTFTTREVDATPTINPTTTLEFLQSSGFVLTDQTGGVSRVDLLAIPVNKLAAQTASRVLVSDASGFLSPSSVTSTTLAFLDATSSIQTQLNGKQASFSAGNLLAGSDLSVSGGTGKLVGGDATVSLGANVTVLGSTIDVSSAEITGVLKAAAFPALTGDVTTSAGALATTIANDAVTFAKFQNINTARLLGRTTASSGNVEEISIGKGLTFGSTLLSLTEYVYNVVEYGADPTCTSDSLAAIHLARDTLRAASIKRGKIYFPAGCYLISGSIVLGDGTSTTVTTVDNGVTLEGDAGVRTATNTETLGAQTQLVWTGGTDTTTPMIDVRGAIGGVKIKGISLNADSKAGVGIKIVHAQSAALEDISIFAFRGIGLDVTSWNTGGFNGCPSCTESTGLFGDNGSLKNFLINSVINDSTGIRLGSEGTTANWYFERGQIRQDFTTGSSALELRHADHNQFVDVVASAETGVRIKPIAIAPGFPMNNLFIGGSWNGAHASTTLTSSVSNIDTTINVADTTNFPSAGYAQIVEIGGNTETFRYTSKTGTTLVLTSAALRGLHNTAAIAHVSGLTVSVAMDVVIDETDATWTPTTGYSGLDFRPFPLADNAVVPTDKRIWGYTDKRRHFGGNESFDAPLRIGNITSADMTASDGIRFQGVDGANSAVLVSDVYGATAANLITGRVAGGTALSPSATPADAFMIGLSARGWDTAFVSGSKGLIAIKAQALWTGSSNPTYITLETTPVGGTSRVGRARMSAGGVWNTYKGADVASAATIVPTGNTFHVTGTTGITAISTTDIQPGTTITIIFDGALTITHASGSLYLTGATNFTTSANDILTFLYDGTKWYEIARINN